MQKANVIQSGPSRQIAHDQRIRLAKIPSTEYDRPSAKKEKSKTGEPARTRRRQFAAPVEKRQRGKGSRTVIGGEFVQASRARPKLVQGSQNQSFRGKGRKIGEIGGFIKRKRVFPSFQAQRIFFVLG